MKTERLQPNRRSGEAAFHGCKGALGVPVWMVGATGIEPVTPTMSTKSTIYPGVSACRRLFAKPLVSLDTAGALLPLVIACLLPLASDMLPEP
jgi:hypothetical protein